MSRADYPVRKLKRTECNLRPRQRREQRQIRGSRHPAPAIRMPGRLPASVSAHIESTYEIELSNRAGKVRQPHDPEPSQSFDIMVGVTLQGDGVRQYPVGPPWILANRYRRFIIGRDGAWLGTCRPPRLLSSSEPTAFRIPA